MERKEKFINFRKCQLSIAELLGVYSDELNFPCNWDFKCTEHFSKKYGERFLPSMKEKMFGKFKDLCEKRITNYFPSMEEFIEDCQNDGFGYKELKFWKIAYFAYGLITSLNETDKYCCDQRQFAILSTSILQKRGQMNDVELYENLMDIIEFRDIKEPFDMVGVETTLSLKEVRRIASTEEEEDTDNENVEWLSKSLANTEILAGFCRDNDEILSIPKFLSYKSNMGSLSIYNPTDFKLTFNVFSEFSMEVIIEPKEVKEVYVEGEIDVKLNDLLIYTGQVDHLFKDIRQKAVEGRYMLKKDYKDLRFVKKKPLEYSETMIEMHASVTLPRFQHNYFTLAVSMLLLVAFVGAQPASPVVSLSATPSPTISVSPTPSISFTPTPSHTKVPFHYPTVFPWPVSSAGILQPLLSLLPVILIRNKFGLALTILLSLYGAEACLCLGGNRVRSIAESEFLTASNETLTTFRYGMTDPILPNATFCECLPPTTRQPEFKRSLVLQDPVTSVYVYLEENVIRLVFDTQVDRVINVKVNGETYSYVGSDLSVYFVLPVDDLYYTSVAYVQVIEDSDEIYSGTFEIQGSRECVIKDCWTCNLNWGCMPKIARAATILSLVFVSLIIVWLLVNFSVLFCCCFKVMTKSLWCFSRGLVGGLNNKSRSLAKWWMAPVVVSTAMACSVGVISQVPVQSCLQTPNSFVCDIQISNTIYFNGPGEEACFQIMKEDQQIAQMKVSVDSKELKCFANGDTTYTYMGKIYEGSTFRCNHAGPCPGDCDNPGFNATGLMPEFTYQSISECERSCSGGLIPCQCLSPGAGCTFYEFTYYPEGDHVAYSALGYCQISLVISYSLSDMQGNVLSNSMVSEMGVIEDDYFTISVVGSVNSMIPNGLPSHMVYANERTYLVNAAYHGVPKANMIGDIQCANGNVSQCIFDPNIRFSTVSKGKWEQQGFHPPGLKLLEREKPLPTVHAGSIWNANFNSVSTILTGPDPIIMQVLSKSNVTVVAINQETCPREEDEKIAGCYGCREGALLSFMAWSECFDGAVVVSSEKGNFPNQMIQLTRNKQNFTIPYFTKDSQVSDNIKVGKLEFKIDGNLNPAIQIGQETILYTNKSNSASKSFINGGWSWWEYGLFSVTLLIVVLCIVAVSIGIAVLFPYSYLVSGFMRMKRLFMKETPRNLPTKRTEEKVKTKVPNIYSPIYRESVVRR